MPIWSEQVIWWQLHPISFTGAGRAAQPARTPMAHRLGRIEAWLDYLIGLGCNGLALGPVFASGSHGYDTVDHFRIDPRLGSEADFGHLVGPARNAASGCAGRGIQSRRPRLRPFQDVLAHGAGPGTRRGSGSISGQRAGRVRLCGLRGAPRLVELNHAEPAVQDYAARVLSHWLDRGADGWRLDAAYAVPPAFWRAVLGRVRRAHPRAWFVAEMIHGDYAAMVRDGGLDSVTQYELWKAIWSSLNDSPGDRRAARIAGRRRIRHRGSCLRRRRKDLQRRGATHPPRRRQQPPRPHQPPH